MSVVGLMIGFVLLALILVSPLVRFIATAAVVIGTVVAVGIGVLFVMILHDQIQTSHEPIAIVAPTPARASVSYNEFLERVNSNHMQNPAGDAIGLALKYYRDRDIAVDPQ